MNCDRRWMLCGSLPISYRRVRQNAAASGKRPQADECGYTRHVFVYGFQDLDNTAASASQVWRTDAATDHPCAKDQKL